MRISYNNLFKLLIDKQMMKGELCRQADISTTTLGKMAKGNNITVDVLAKICGVLNCTFDDIVELIPDDNNGKKQ
jgi:DNA-binding Xre family transcriptional regulator